MNFFDSEEDDEEVVASDSEEEENPGVAKAVVESLRNKTRTLQYLRDGPRVYCPLCPNKDPLLDLQALHQHCAQQSDKWHNHVAVFIVTEVLRLPAHATKSNVHHAAKHYESQRGSKRSADTAALGSADNNAQIRKAAMIYVHERDLSERDTLKIMWPPSVLIWASRHSRISLEKPDQIREWMGSKANFRLLPEVKVHEGYRPNGDGTNAQTGCWLVTFPDRSPVESFLEAIQLDLVIREARHNRDFAGHDNGLALSGELVTTDLPTGWKNHKQYRLEGFRGKVMSAEEGQRVMKAEAMTDAVQAEATKQHLELALEETAKVMTQETQNIKNRFEETMQELEEEKQKTNALREAYHRRLQEQEQEQQRHIADVESKYKKHLTSLKKQNIDEVAKQKEEFQMEHDLRQLRYEKDVKEKMDEMESKHQEEKMRLWKRAAEQRKKDREEYERKMKKIEQASSQKAKAQQINRANIEQSIDRMKLKLKQEHEARLQRMVKDVEQTLEEQFRENLKLFEEKIEEKKAQHDATDMQDSEFETSLVELKDELETANLLLSATTVQGRLLTDELEGSKMALREKYKKDLGYHWAFGREGWRFDGNKKDTDDEAKVFEDSDYGFRQSGDLASDNKFMDTLWAAICLKHGLPPNTSRTCLDNLNGRFADKWDDARTELSQMTSAYQTTKVENPNFEPWKSNPNFKSNEPEGADNVKYFKKFTDMEDVRADYGEAVRNELWRVTLELHEHNPSGRYQILVPWNLKKDREAKLAEMVDAMEARGDAMRKLIMACRNIMSHVDFEKVKKGVEGTLKVEPRRSGRARATRY